MEQQKETKQQYLIRKLKVFGKYYQSNEIVMNREITPHVMDCDVCSGPADHFAFIHFSHKNQDFDLTVCKDCVNQAGIVWTPWRTVVEKYIASKPKDLVAYNLIDNEYCGICSRKSRRFVNLPVGDICVDCAEEKGLEFKTNYKTLGQLGYTGD